MQSCSCRPRGHPVVVTEVVGPFLVPSVRPGSRSFSAYASVDEAFDDIEYVECLFGLADKEGSDSD